MKIKIYTTLILAAILSSLSLVSKALELPAVNNQSAGQQTHNAMELDGSTYKVVFNPDNGGIEYILNKSTGKKIVLGQEKNTLWNIKYIDDSETSSSEYSSASKVKKFSYLTKNDTLILKYTSGDFIINIEFGTGQRYFDMRMRIFNPPKIVLGSNFPYSITFSPRQINKVYFPHNLGIAIKQKFYTLGLGFKQREFGLQQKNIMRGSYPDNFSDYVYLDSRDGVMALYGIQKANEIFVPATYETGYTDWNDGAAYYDHTFVTYVAEKQKWSSPIIRIEIDTSSVVQNGIDKSLSQSLLNYSKENGFTTLMDDKMPADKMEKFKKSMLIFFTGRYTEMANGLDLLPSPVLLHFANYLSVGFDRNYPDHLPPNPQYGTPQEFRAFYDRAHEKGMLVMPYTNPTWWCNYPASPAPSVVKYGEAPLAIGLNGKVQIEKYANNTGWSLTFNHPIAKEVRRRDIKALTEEYPSDIILQDQVGARSIQYDLNPACPVPYAYIQGLIDIAREDSKTVPLSTEDGYDRILNYELQFCGCTWHIPLVAGKNSNSNAWVYPELLGSELYEICPFVHVFAHDKVAFTHHDLGVFITDRTKLRWSLALGYQMSYRTSPSALKGERVIEWIRWLDLIQKNIVYNYMGKQMLNFEYIADGVSRTTFSGGVVIVANHLDRPYRVDESMVIAPRGFYAVAGDNLVGTFIEYDKKPLEKEKWILRIGTGEKAQYQYFTPPLDMY